MDCTENISQSFLSLNTTQGADFKLFKVFKKHTHGSQRGAHKMCFKPWCSVRDTLFICCYKWLPGVKTLQNIIHSCDITTEEPEMYPPADHSWDFQTFSYWCFCFWEVGCDTLWFDSNASQRRVISEKVIPTLLWMNLINTQSISSLQCLLLPISPIKQSSWTAGGQHTSLHVAVWRWHWA